MKGISLFSFISIIFALKTKETINKLFYNNIKSKYSSNELYQNDIKQHFNKILENKNENNNNIYILEYSNNCGLPCHSYIENITTNKGFKYEIINSDHGLIHIDYINLQLIQQSLNIILDYIPLLPQLKIDEDVNIEKLCYNESIINIHIVFISLNQNDLDDLQNLIVYHKELFPTNYTFPISEISLIQPIQTLLFPFLCKYAEQALTLFSSLSSVQWIEVRPTMKSTSYWANGITQSGKVQVNILNEANLTGYNQIIGIADTGIDINSCFFYDPNNEVVYNTYNSNHRKIIYYQTYANSVDDDGHGTLVSGTSSGNCYDKSNSNKDYNGISPNSKIAFFDIGLADRSLTIPSNLYSNLFLKLYNNGAKIQSMSWGSSSNKYTTDARNVDIFMWDYPDSLIFVAAGNSGDNGAGTVGTPATNKNGVTVGATLNSRLSFKAYDILPSSNEDDYDPNSLASFSSRGPTYDNRMKPDVCGVGSYITNAGIGSPSSTTEQCSTTVERGTSFACPLLAGGATLIREYFVSGYYPTGKRNPSNGFIPSGSLIKALLIHSTKELDKILSDDGSTDSTTIGDNNQGFGRVQLNRALSFGVNSTLNGLTYFIKGAAFKSSEHYVELATKSSFHTYKFRTLDLDNLEPIRITLAYTDYYSASGSTTVLLNDLDITLSNSTHSFYPIVSNSQSKWDRLNNVEIIRLDKPMRNTTYTVRVSVFNLVKTQPYSLVISGNIGEYPYKPPEDDYRLYILAALLIMILLSCCILGCVCYMIRRKNKENKENEKNGKKGARMNDDSDNDDNDDENRTQDIDEEKNLKNQSKVKNPKDKNPNLTSKSNSKVNGNNNVKKSSPSVYQINSTKIVPDPNH